MGSIQSELNRAMSLSTKTVAGEKQNPSNKLIRKRKQATPNAVAVLFDKYGSKKTAEMLGITPSGLSSILSRTKCSATVEMLAEMLVLCEGEQIVTTKTQIVITRVPGNKVEALCAVLDAMGIKHWNLSDG